MQSLSKSLGGPGFFPLMVSSRQPWPYNLTFSGILGPFSLFPRPQASGDPEAQAFVFLVRTSCNPYHQGNLENMALDNRICLKNRGEGKVGAGREKQIPRPQDLESRVQ